MKPALTPTRLDRAVTVAASVFEVPRREIQSRCRVHAVTRARLALYAALYTACATSYLELARYLRRDHSSILAGCRKAQSLADADPDYAACMARIMEACR
jgi:chromosomal replication initiation ATPase DnaA